MSPDLNHGPAAIWAHLHLVFDYGQKGFPHVKTVYIFCDGPTTQSLTWNFFESGHGKGAADSVGGTIKHLADHFVTSGHDIVEAYEFFEALKDRSKTKLFLVSKDDIAQILMTIPSGIVSLKGTIQIYQLFAQQSGTLSYRMMSCFCDKFCTCYNIKTYRPFPEDEKEVCPIIEVSIQPQI